MLHLKTFERFINESSIFELNEKIGDVNYRTDKFALVCLGGSIGGVRSFSIFVQGQMGSIYETGNDRTVLTETAKRMRKQLSPGERKYYGMNYTVIELTPNKIKEIEDLESKKQLTTNESTDTREINEACTRS